MKRSQVLTIIEAALTVGDTRYAREAASQLLAAWPGDLSGQWALARAYVGEGEAGPAIDLLEAIVAVDPENSPAQRMLGTLFHSAGRRDHAAQAFTCAHVMDGRGMPLGLVPPEWAEPAFWARLAVDRREWETARPLAERALASHPDVPLPSMLCLASLWRAGGLELARPLAEGFHARWPGCVTFTLCLAECLLGGSPDGRDSARAIALLHEAGTLDPAGEIVTRYWGAVHPYRSLWPFPPNPDLPGPLPHDVSDALGMNRLPAVAQDTRHKEQGTELADADVTRDTRARTPSLRLRAEASAGTRHVTPGTRHSSPVTHRQLPVTNYQSFDAVSIQAELDRLAAQIRHPKTSNPQLPITNALVHVVLTSQTRLIHKFGADAAAEIVVKLSELAEVSARSGGCEAHVIYVDDRDSLRPFDLRPAKPEQAWEIKLLLRDLSHALGQQGKKINSLLIVGGDDLVPFHRLPNPIDDADGEVPSDNPYATPDDNFFIPEWPVGRLPAPAGGDPAPLIRLLGATIAAHKKESAAGRNSQSPISNYQLLLSRLRVFLTSLFSRRARLGPKSFGYAARAWHQASAAVFAAIGDVRHLNTCPPLDVSRLPSEGLAPAALSYFNLHGVEDGPEWYGQREASDLRSPQYPIALRPSDVVNSGRAPGLVFTEACYGANIMGKAVDDALCLKFLDSGSRGVVGSTKIAYGSVASPLIGADLLGRRFWDALKEGWPIGEALRRAKLALAGEMHQRQGYLDGEDQKTLISFILYGDPLLHAPSTNYQSPMTNLKSQISTLRSLQSPDMTLCADESVAADLGLSRPETVAHVKSLVARYLPGMEEADLHVAQQHRFSATTVLGASSDDLSRQFASAKTLGPHTGNVVFTLSKAIRADAGSPREFSQFVRVTVDRRGKVVKMAVSR